MIKDNRKEQEAFFGIARLATAILALALALSQTSCSRTGFKVELYREDDVKRVTTEEATSSTSALRCIFTNCFKETK